MELFRLFGVIDIQGNMALQQLRQIDSQARSAGSVLGDLAKRAVSVAAGFGLWQGFSSTVRSLGQAFVGLNSRFQQAGLAFETMLGSSQRAKAFLEDLEEFAARTPFEFPELMDASQRMMALGFTADEVLPILRAVGDAAAALGKGKAGIDRIILALGQMRAKGKVTGEEMRQLVENGIPAWDILAKAIGKSVPEVQKLAEKGVIPADKAVRALVAGMEERFPNMMDRLADTFEGVTSTIRDNLQMTFRDLTKGLFESLTDSLKRVRDWTSGLRDAFKAGGLEGVYEFLVPPDLRRALDPLVASARSAWESIADAARKAWPVLKDIGQTAVRVFAPVGTVFLEVAGAAARFAGMIADNWPRLKPIVVGVGGAFLAFATARAILSQVSGTLAAFRAGMELLPKATGFVSRLGTAFMELRTAPNILTGISGAFKALFGASPMVLAVSAAVAGLALLAYELYKNWKDVPPFFRFLWETIKATFALGWSGIAVVLREMQLGIAKTLNATLGNVIRFAAKVAEVFGKIPGAGELVGGIRRALGGAADWFGGFEEASAKALDEAKAGIAEAASSLGKRWEELKVAGSVLGRAIASDLAGIFAAAKAKAKEAFGTIVPGLKDVGDRAADAGRAVGAGLREGLEIGAEEAEKAAQKAASAIERLVSEAGNTLGEGTEKAVVRLKNAFAMALLAVRSLGGETARTLEGDLGEAAALIEAAVREKSEDAALALLEKLGKASAKVASLIKDDSGEAAQALKNALSDAVQEVRDRFQRLAEDIKRSQIESIDRLNDALVSALKRRYEKEKEERTKAIRDAIDAEKRRVDAVIAEINRERWAREEATNDALRLQIRSIWAEIDALDELTRKEEEEAKQAERRARILELQAKIAEEADPTKRQELQMKLAEELARQEREQLLAQREERKRELQRRLEDIRYHQEQSLKAFQAARQKELDYLENEYYPRLLQDAALQAEAEKMILAGKHAEILELLKRYGEGWRDLGITFGQRLIEGIGPYIDELNKMVSFALEAAGVKVSKTTTTAKTTAKTTTTPTGRTLTPEEASVQERYVSEVLRRLGPEKGAEWLKERPTPGAAIVGGKYYEFHEGGVVKGGPLAEFLRRLFSLRPREVPAILEEGEIVLPRTFRLPDLTLKPPALALAGIPSPIFNFNNCTFLDGTDAGRRAFDEFYSQLRRTGVMRR